MTRRRAFTDEQCAELARWAATRCSLTDKARELGVTIATLRDAIKRGQGKPTGHMQRKVMAYLVEAGLVPRETDTNG